MNRYLKEKFFQNDGFTLIELLMVVIILGILAAVAIPQFSASSTDAKIAALKSNLASIRGALELYAVQHAGNYPSANIFNQITLYTDASGTAQNTKDVANGFKYGPYLKNPFPKMPFATKNEDMIFISAKTAIGTVTATADPNDGGWLYVTATGEFIANDGEYDHL